MTLRELITTYWSQTTLILAAIAYFINRYFNILSKKNETKYSLFQQNKINAIVRFFSLVSEVERMWHKLPIYSVIRRELTALELDELIWPSLNELEKCLFELKLYLDEKELNLFESVKAQFSNVNKVVSEAFSNGTEQQGVNWGNEYYFANQNAIKNVKGLLTEIGENIKESFKSQK